MVASELMRLMPAPGGDMGGRPLPGVPTLRPILPLGGAWCALAALLAMEVKSSELAAREEA